MINEVTTKYLVIEFHLPRHNQHACHHLLYHITVCDNEGELQKQRYLQRMTLKRTCLEDPFWQAEPCFHLQHECGDLERQTTDWLVSQPEKQTHTQ